MNSAQHQSQTSQSKHVSSPHTCMSWAHLAGSWGRNVTLWCARRIRFASDCNDKAHIPHTYVPWSSSVWKNMDKFDTPCFVVCRAENWVMFSYWLLRRSTGARRNAVGYAMKLSSSAFVCHRHHDMWTRVVNQSKESLSLMLLLAAISISSIFTRRHYSASTLGAAHAQHRNWGWVFTFALLSIN